MRTKLRGIGKGARYRFVTLVHPTGCTSSTLVKENAERHAFFDQLTIRYKSLRADVQEWSIIEAERTFEEDVLRDRSA